MTCSVAKRGAFIYSASFLPVARHPSTAVFLSSVAPCVWIHPKSRHLGTSCSTKALPGDTDNAVKRVTKTVWRGVETINSVDQAVAYLPFRKSHFMNSADDEIRKGCNSGFPNAFQTLDGLFSEPIMSSTVYRRSIDHPSINPWFRGATNKNWNLEPAFQRRVRDSTGQGYVLDETHALNLIISNYPQLRTMTLFDALAMLQHYTFPTRLLDWSQNPLNALLFACIDLNGTIDETNDGELFILNPLKLNYYTCSRWGLLNSEHYEAMMRLRLAVTTDYQAFTHRKFIDPSDKFFSSQIDFDYEKYLNDRRQFNVDPWHLGKELATPIAVNPVRHNQRLMVQQGSFTLHGGKVYHSATSAGDSFRLPGPLTIEDVQDAVTVLEEEKFKKGKNNVEPVKFKEGGTENPYSPLFISSVIIPKDQKKKISIDLEQRGITLGKLLPELDYVSRATQAIWMIRLPSGIKDIADPPSVVELLPQDVNSEKIRSLMLLVKGNKREEIKSALADSASYHLLGRRPKGDTSAAGPTVLYEMAALGRYDMMKEVLDNCEKAVEDKKLSPKQFKDIINTPNHLGWTPLYGAILYGHADCARALIDAKASRKIEGDDLHNNLQNSLLSHAIRLEKKSAGLIKLCSYDKDDPTSWLPDSLEPSMSNVFGRCPIHYACALGSIEAVAALLPYHRTLNVYQKDPLARTPLQIACMEGHVDIVKELIESTRTRVIDLDINYRTPYGKSAIDFVLAMTSFRDEGSLGQDNNFFDILEELFLKNAEIISVNGFVHHNFRQILALTREIILIRDIKFSNEDIDKYRAKIIDLLDEDWNALKYYIADIIEKAENIVALSDEEKRKRDKTTDLLYEDAKKLAVEILKLIKGEEKLPAEEEEYKLKAYHARAIYLNKLFQEFKKEPEKAPHDKAKGSSTCSESKGTPSKEAERSKASASPQPGKQLPKEDTKTAVSNLEKQLSKLINIRNKYLELDKNGLSILSYLVRLNDPKIIQKIHDINPGAVHHLTDDEWSLPLSEACFFGAKAAVEKLCDLSAKIGDHNKQKVAIGSPLTWAVWGCRLDIVEKLISQLEKTTERVSDYLDMRNVQHHTLLSIAVIKCGSFAPSSLKEKAELKEEAQKIVDLLLKKGASVKQFSDAERSYPGIYHDKNSILHLAAMFRAPEEVFKKLVQSLPLEEQKKILNSSNSIGERPIHCAVDHDAEDIVKWLKSYRFSDGTCAVDLTQKTADGRTWEDYSQRNKAASKK